MSCLALLSKTCVRGFHSTQAAALPYGLRADGWWIRDHRASRCPRTEEDRLKSALRYGLRPEDYKPYSPTKEASGDYPDLGVFTYDHKDPYEDWSVDKHRRNWCEPVSWYWDIHRADRQTFTGLEREITEGGNKAKLYAAAFSLWGSLFLLAYWLISDRFAHQPQQFVIVKPVMPKHYPYDFYRAWPFEDYKKYPILNYSFEPAEEN